MADSQILPLNKKSKPSDDESEFDPTNCFNELPQEMVIEILSRLPIKSLMQFTFTCRTLYPLSHDPHLGKRHLSRSDSSSSSLVILSEFPQKTQLYFLQLSDQKVNKFHVPFAQSMPKFNIIGSSNGLLCLINSLFNESICIYNPFTRDYFELPKHLDGPCQFVVHGFGFDPVAHDYKVVKMAYYESIYRPLCNRKGRSHTDTQKLFNSPQKTQVTVYSKRSNAWINKGVIPYKMEMRSTGVLVSGRLHWVTVWGKHEGFDHLQCLIVSYDLVDDELRVIKGPCYFWDDQTSGIYLSYHLSVMDDCLCASVPVASGHGSLDIWVMESGVEESWTQKYTIGEYSLSSMVSYQLGKQRHIWRNLFRKKNVKVVCILEGGEVVLEYSRKGDFMTYDRRKKSFKELEYEEMPRTGEVLKYRGGGLMVYDPRKKSIKELEYAGMPRIYQATAHVGNLLPSLVYLFITACSCGRWHNQMSKLAQAPMNANPPNSASQEYFLSSRNAVMEHEQLRTSPKTPVFQYLKGLQKY